MKTLASLLFLATFVPSVHAQSVNPAKFPPCDGQFINFVPLGTGTTGSPFTVEHSYVGLESEKTGHIIGGGNCRIVFDLPPPDALYKGAATVGLTPSTGLAASFGVAALPEWPTVASPGQEVAYTLSFDISTPAPIQGDWLDLVQLDFKRSDLLSSNAGFSTVYRLRKTFGANGVAVVLIESRAANPNEREIPTDRVVATLPADGNGMNNYIALRWTQKVLDNVAALNGSGRTPVPGVETRMQLLDANGTPLYTTTFINEFANSFSMGLLNHSTTPGAYPSDSIIEFSNATLSAQSIP